METTLRRPQRIRESTNDRIFLGIVYAMLTIVLVIILYPLLYVVSSSLSDPLAVSSGLVKFLPVQPTFAGYEVALKNPQIVTGYLNSLIYSVVGSLISVTLTVALAYPLSRKSLFGRSAVMMFIVFTMLFSGGLIPTYLVVKQLNMLDTRWAMVIPQAVAVWQVIIARTFFQSSIPDELAEAAELDGASDLRFLWSVVIPLSKPIIAVLILMYAIFQWNSYFDALIYLRNPSLFPLQLVLRNIVILNTISTSTLDPATQLEMQRLSDLLKYSLIVIASVPVLLIYPFVQRYFVRGMLIGAIKG